MDTAVAYRDNEKFPVYADLTAETGTLTLSQPTYILYDAAGAAAAGGDVTGYDVAADDAPRAWVNLNTADALIVPGRYTLVFSIPVTGSDTIVRTYTPTVRVHVLTAEEWYALGKLRIDAQALEAPTLSDGELSEILDRWRRAKLWAAGAVYAVGDRVVSTSRNGRIFLVTVAGTSGATEPDWGNDNGQYLGSAVRDGTGDLLWIDAGAAYGDLWDYRGALHDAWMLKAAKATCPVDVSNRGKSLMLSQRYKHCREMAAAYAPLVVG